MDAIELPRHVDDPPHLLLWQADELAPLLVCLVFGVLLGKALPMFLIGLATTKLYSRYRDGRADGFFYHAVYWSGILPSTSPQIPNPYAREFHV